MAPSTTSLGRRAFLRSATAAATLATVEAARSSTASAASRGGDEHPVEAPKTVDLPDGIRPEGITSGPGTRFYVGSLADGRIVAGNLRDGTSTVLLEGATGRQLRGLYWDRRTRLVWAAGNVGDVAHVYAVSSRSGEVVQDTVVPGAVFLNDLVVSDRAVWVTDSRVDRLTRISLHRHGWPTGESPEFVRLRGAWPRFDGSAINANGIRRLRDGSLVLNNSRVGGLWRVDLRDAVTTRIPVLGGPRITGGDGLELDRDVLYNVRGTGQKEVSVLRLAHHADGTWSAKWVKALTDSTLDVPSTATTAGGWLWAVNARFGVASPEKARYWVTRLPAEKGRK
jgi:hypothetical protein